MKVQYFLHAPSHLFLLVFLNIFAAIAAKGLLYTVSVLSIIELLILCLNKVYRYKNSEWIITPKYRIVEICLAGLSVLLCVLGIIK